MYRPDILHRVTPEHLAMLAPAVIYKLIQTFHFRITGFVVDIQVTV